MTAAKEKAKSSCKHSKAYIAESSFWNGSEYETVYHCSKCYRILRKESVRLGNNVITTRYVEQEEFRVLQIEPIGVEIVE